MSSDTGLLKRETFLVARRHELLPVIWGMVGSTGGKAGKGPGMLGINLNAPEMVRENEGERESELGINEERWTVVFVTLIRSSPACDCGIHSRISPSHHSHTNTCTLLSCICSLPGLTTPTPNMVSKLLVGPAVFLDHRWSYSLQL